MIKVSQNNLMLKNQTLSFNRSDVDGDDLMDEMNELNEVSATGNLTLGEAASDDVRGEQDIGGDMPDPAIDDDALDMAHKMGIASGADYENPQELTIAQDIEQAERSNR